MFENNKELKIFEDYDEVQDFEEWANVTIGALLKEAKEAERIARRNRDLVEALEAAKSAARHIYVESLQ